MTTLEKSILAYKTCQTHAGRNTVFQNACNKLPIEDLNEFVRFADAHQRHINKTVLKVRFLNNGKELELLLYKEDFLNIKEVFCNYDILTYRKGQDVDANEVSSYNNAFIQLTIEGVENA